VGIYFDTISEQELFKIADYKNYLPKIFSEDQIIAYTPQEFFYSCRCSVERIKEIAKQMSIEIDEKFEIKCEYCGKRYLKEDILI
jgi:redox-regulated HSP33 family molecular chaperone